MSQSACAGPLELGGGEAVVVGVKKRRGELWSSRTRVGGRTVSTAPPRWPWGAATASLTSACVHRSCLRPGPWSACGCEVGGSEPGTPPPQDRLHFRPLCCCAVGPNSHTCVRLVPWPESGHGRHCWRRCVQGTQTQPWLGPHRCCCCCFSPWLCFVQSEPQH